MPFSPNASLISTDMDNTLRGLYRDNADVSVTGTLAETILKSFSIGSGIIGPTGAIHIVACGTVTNTAGTKTLRLKFGSTTIATIIQAAGTTSDWYFDAWLFNTTNNSQKWFVLKNGNDLLTSSFDFTSSTEDTTSNKSLVITGQLGSVGDIASSTIFDIFVIQIQ